MLVIERLKIIYFLMFIFDGYNLYMKGMIDQAGSRTISDLSIDSIQVLFVDFIQLKIRSNECCLVKSYRRSSNFPNM
jgi:hypothetical protein